jgi:hypothetical protein
MFINRIVFWNELLYKLLSSAKTRFIKMNLQPITKRICMMSVPPKKTWKEKSNSSKEPKPEHKKILLEKTKGNELPCALAFKISKDHGIPMDQIGIAADFLKIRLTKCQLGLFGYKPEKKIVKTLTAISKSLEEKIKTTAYEGKISCKAAWQIASDLDITKLEVGNACESFSIKIGSCQLGAF